MPKDFIKDLAKRPLLSKSPAGQAKVPYRTGLHTFSHRVHTEWQWTISGAHSNSIMMEKSALAGEGLFERPHPFNLFIIMSTVAVYAPAERADTIPVFHLYPICTLYFLSFICSSCIQSWPFC
jgi:hypothetical protein